MREAQADKFGMVGHDRSSGVGDLHADDRRLERVLCERGERHRRADRVEAVTVDLTVTRISPGWVQSLLPSCCRSWGSKPRLAHGNASLTQPLASTPTVKQRASPSCRPTDAPWLPTTSVTRSPFRGVDARFTHGGKGMGRVGLDVE